MKPILRKKLHLSPEELRKVYVNQVVVSERSANKNTWISCLNCWMVSGKYGEGAVIGLAQDIGKSDDTVYARAHAYSIFVELCNFDGGKYRLLTHTVRRMPWVYWSHFRQMWDLKTDFQLETKHLLDLLLELYQSEGMSVRDMEGVVRGKLGKERPWMYYADRALKEMKKTVNQPKTPRSVRSQMKKVIASLDKKIGRK